MMVLYFKVEIWPFQSNFMIYSLLDTPFKCLMKKYMKDHTFISKINVIPYLFVNENTFLYNNMIPIEWGEKQVIQFKDEKPKAKLTWLYPSRWKYIF